MLRFSNNTRYCCLVFCVLAIFCFCQAAPAQSRRVPQKNAPATDKNAPSTEQTAPVVESKSAETKDEIQADPTPVRISSLLLVGEVQHDFTYYKSNDIDNAMKEFIRFLELISKSTPQMTRGSGKMSYTQAKEQAQKETGNYVLWMGFAAKDDGYGNMYIDFVQYAVIAPKTGKVLTRSQVKPGQNSVVGGVMQIPAGRRRTSGSAYSEMKDCARQIAAILSRGGWLK